jgi:hypothetical protein
VHDHVICMYVSQFLLLHLKILLYSDLKYVTTASFPILFSSPYTETSIFLISF